MALTPIGFPAQPRQDLLERLISDLRGRADTARQEVVTGLLADPAAALGGKVSELLEVNRSLAETAQYREIIGLAESRATAIQGSLETLRSLAVDLHVQGQTALDTGLEATGEAVSATARQALGAAISALNTSFGGRHLFSGDAGDSQAVVSAETIMAASVPVLEAGPTGGQAYANLTVAFTAAGGLFDTTFYTGGSGDAPATEVARGERLDFAPRADTDPIRALLRDLTALAAAYDRSNAIPDDEREAVATHAIAGLRNNVEALAGMAARVGVAEERMDTVQARHNATEAALTLAYNKLAGRDQYEASAELTQLEAQLETAYLTTARLANLSLANFLR
jgi:flagellar hook-associated protein 3 FlgL